MFYLNINREICNREWSDIMDTLALTDRLLSAETIVIKPNLAAGTYVNPDAHVITDMGLLRSVIEYFVSVNPYARIYISESDSTGYGFAYLKFEHLGLPYSLGLSEKAIRRVELLDLSRDQLKRVESKDFKRYANTDRQLWLSKTLSEADFTVNLSNLKTHSVTGYTGACKNLFGCLPDFEKYHNHPYIHEIIHDLVLAIKPELNIVDAFYGMEKNGPVQGMAVDSGYRVFSDNPVEADMIAALSVGYAPDKIKYIRLLRGTKHIALEKHPVLTASYQRPEFFLRLMNEIGITIQKIGLHIETFGHRIHSCSTPASLIVTVFRPVLLLLFDYEKLKIWKKKLLKE